MTREQSLALVEAMVTSPKVKAHLGCALGFRKVPSASDFEATHAEAVERCEDLIMFLRETQQTLDAVHRQRPKQKRIDFDKPEETNGKTQKRRGRRKAVK